MNNGEEGGLNFDQSIESNLVWLKKIATEHDCSQGLAASAALMTMTMMDHHNLHQRLSQLDLELTEIKSMLACLSNSSPAVLKES